MASIYDRRLFLVRLAGNFANDDELASLEYPVKFLGVPLVVVLGHSNCGAVEAAIKLVKDNATLPRHLRSLVQTIKPAVEAVQAKSPKNLLATAITENVALNVKNLENAQPLLASFAQTAEVEITGGAYDLATGKVGLLSWIRKEDSKPALVSRDSTARACSEKVERLFRREHASTL